MQLDTLLAEIEQYITQQYREHFDPRIVYHDLRHVREVVSASITLSGHYGLDQEQQFPILAAAWFHDLAYVHSGPEHHEERSSVLAREFLLQRGVDEGMIRRVERCILATHVPQQPGDLPEKIIADADLFHLGKPIFQEKNDLLKKEMEMLGGKEISGSAWRASTIQFLEQHHFHTDYAIQNLQPAKELAYQDLKARHEKKLAKQAEKVAAKELAATVVQAAQESPTGTDGIIIPAPAAAAKKKKKEKDDRYSRGVETLFRLTSRNHMELSALADNKAGIMISVNSIIISVILTVLLRKLEDQPHLIIPTIIMLSVNIATIIFAILATRPKIVGTHFTADDIRNRRINMLFFGHFNKMRLEDYQNGISEMLTDRNYLYQSITKDIYYLGIVLGKKYRYISISYTIFMYGLIASVIAFALAIGLHS